MAFCAFCGFMNGHLPEESRHYSGVVSHIGPHFMLKLLLSLQGQVLSLLLFPGTIPVFKELKECFNALIVGCVTSRSRLRYTTFER